MKSQNTDISFRSVMTISQTICLVLLIVLVIIGAVSCSTMQELKLVQQESTSTATESAEEITSAPASTTTTTQSVAETKEEPLVARTLYDDLTPYEVSLLEIVVQHEVGNFSKRYKTYVAELIYNRLVSEEFPDTVYDVLFQKGQFQGIVIWSKSGEVVPDEETKVVVKEVFSNENPSHNCTFYYNPELSEDESILWFENSDTINYVFSYTERTWGVEYTTRFFELKK